jgi:hypothetical protein
VGHDGSKPAGVVPHKHLAAYITPKFSQNIIIIRKKKERGKRRRE